MTTIPKLVREKIQIYLNEIYQKRWQENINNMHKQYNNIISVKVSPIYGTHIFYTRDYEKIPIVTLDEYSYYSRSALIKTFHKTNWRAYNNRKIIPFISDNYYYSSGLSHPQAYR